MRHDPQLAALAPRRVVLFSGHRVDDPARPSPRFPPQKVQAAAGRIARWLAAAGIGAADLVLTQGANGGDLLCAEAAADRAARVAFLLPEPEPEFLRHSVAASDDAGWLARYGAMRQRLCVAPLVAPAAEPDDARSLHERGNAWLLAQALAFGRERLAGLVLWNGERGDGPGGTADMVQALQDAGVPVDRIDPQTL